nr:hypothetical protein [Tanacetum cinerariifolium]GFA08359.1 hypothetical protein [Tanacetum cinerariifolium]
KLLKDLKELAEYDQSTSTDRPIFLNDNEDHHVQNKESPKNSSKETVVSKTNQEPPQDSDIHQLIEECSIKVPNEQKQKIEDAMLELVKICQEKEFLCIHNDVDDLIESALNSKLLLINSKSQRLDKKEKEVKNVVDQPAEHGNRSIQSLQNFKVVHKSSISFKNISQISSIHSVAPIQSTKEPKHLLKELNAEIANTIIESIPLLPILVQDGNSQQEEIDIVTETDDVLPPSIENFADDPEGDISFLEELLIDDFILSHESFDSSFEDNLLIPRPPPELPDVETDAGEEIAVVMIDTDKFDDDYQIFMFDKVFSLLFAESEDTIFDPGISD